MQAAEAEISLDTAQKLGMNESEYKKVVEILGRVPNFTELSIYAAMWSEPNSNKNSIKWIKTLPIEGKRIIDRGGDEDIRIVDIGKGLAFSMRINTSQHDLDSTTNISFRNLYKFHPGIYANGARPFAILNSVNIVISNLSESSQLARQLKNGIAEYGNSIELQNVRSEISFLDNIQQKSLAHTISIGLIPIDKFTASSEIEPGNPVFIIHLPKELQEVPSGSEDTDFENIEDQDFTRSKDSIQEKHLIEAILEAINSGCVLGIQEIESAGIAGASARISSQSHTGMTIELSKIPGVQSEMNSSDILLSNSLGEVLIVGKTEEGKKLLDIFSHWEIECKEIGSVTDTEFLEYIHYGHSIAEITANSLVTGGGAPIYNRRAEKPKYFAQIKKFKNGNVKSTANIVETAKQLFSCPNLISKRKVFKLNESSETSPSVATILKIDDSNKALAIAMHVDSNKVFADPYVGGMIAVAEAARCITCSGGTPVAVANSLNFGNPYQPEEYYQFVNATKGISEACRKFDTPQLDFEVNFSGNPLAEKLSTSFRPTPVIGMMGMISDHEHCTTFDFKEEGDLIYMVGNLSNDLGSSEYLRSIHNIEFSSVPEFDLYEEFEIQKHVRKMIQKKLLKSAHSVSKGGLFASLLESAIHRNYGFNIETVDTFRLDSFLFGESQSRIVISLAPEQEDNLQNYLINNNVSFTKLGEVFGDEIIIDDKKFGSINSWKRIYESSLGDKIVE